MAQEPVFFRWDSLPALPPAKGSLLQHGYAGAFTGVHQEVLILAGGANFPEAMPWEGGQKKYSRDIFYLLPGAPQWQQSKQVLPASLAYGVSLSTTDGILCIGGTDGVSCSREVFRLAWNEEQQEIELQFLPELPEPLAFMGGCLLKGEVYITGG
ncbi:MAG: sodium transporter, partial [Bacteroidota bacterium]